MSRRKYCDCKYCGRPVYPEHKLHRKQNAHTECIHKQHPPDLVVDIGSCHYEIYSELVSRSKLRKFLTNMKRYSKNTIS